MTITE